MSESSQSLAESMAELIEHRSVLVCCGSGGVGKTTTAAALGMAAAQMGRRAAVVTIDPARRLADALGLAGLTNDPQLVALPGTVPGTLSALMLDTKATFDDLVRRESRDADQAEQIFANRFYRNISSSLSGTQEYMAMEKVHELTSHGQFDVVVIDTPPTRNALDFLTAPRRLTRLLDNTLFRILMAPGRGAMRLVGAAAQTLLKPLSRVVGGEVVGDAIDFFQAFDGMEEGFRRRAVETLDLLHASSTAWVLVTSPRPEAVDEAVFFAKALGQTGITVAAVVANRMQPSFGPVPAAIVGSRGRLAVVAQIVEEAENAAAIEEAALLPLLAAVGGIAVVRLLNRAGEVHDLSGLGDLAKDLADVPGA